MLSIRTARSTHEKKLSVVIPSYNNADWCQRNMESVFDQKYTNYRVIYIDDCSSDGTFDCVRSLVERLGQQDRTTCLRNKKRLFALANIYQAVYMCDDNDIIINLDGDDWFPHPYVFSYINEIYQDPNVWLTYSQYKTYPDGQMGFAKPIPLEVVKKNDFRQTQRSTNQLRTFYAWLFKQIRKEDLLYEDRFFPMTYDLAIMFPMQEMAGERFRFLSEILYVYNVANSLNDHKIDAALQRRLDDFIRSKTPYSRLCGPPRKNQLEQHSAC